MGSRGHCDFGHLVLLPGLGLVDAVGISSETGDGEAFATHGMHRLKH